MRPVRHRHSSRGGTTVVLGKLLPARRPSAAETGAPGRAASWRSSRPHDPLAEIQEQNQELLRALEELRERQTEVERLNQELAETNRGVLALYAELDEKAADLRPRLGAQVALPVQHQPRAPHAARTSILNISRLLLDRVDGPLTEEQDRQVRFIRSAATTLSEMVNDLLDLARDRGRPERRPPERVHRGRPVRRAPRHVPRACAVGRRRAGARGAGRHAAARAPTRASCRRSCATSSPTRSSSPSAARSACPRGCEADGRVDVRRRRHRHRHRAARTRTGSSRSSRQLDSALQRKATGTGLGLPLSRKLAELLGGQRVGREHAGVRARCSA